MSVPRSATISPVRTVLDRVDRAEPEPGGQDPVERRRRAAALHVTEHDRAGLLAGPLLHLVGQELADPAEPDVPEGVQPLGWPTVAFSPPSGVAPSATTTIGA